MLRKTRTGILQELRSRREQGGIIVGVGTGVGLAAKCSEKAGVDLLALYHSGRFRMVGRGALSGLLAYGDANEIVRQMGQEVLPLVKKTPVLAGVCGTDPFRVMEIFLGQLKEQGWIGVQNFPTVGIIDGRFRANLEETGMGYSLEVDMIREAHKLDLLTCPYVFDPEQAKAMTEAGADILVAHMGLEVKDTKDFEAEAALGICCGRLRDIIEAGRRENPDILVLCHGGSIEDPEDAAYIIREVPEIDGFFGTSSIERLATERGMTAQAEEFKAIRR
ncbi:MAG: phosphoenolpyruvate hydrolase family protein [Selenomonadaceae bacterium]|nr:phosphoenolpyruvate hydrolase family protein [Selenomonadaceae bacterium]